MMKASERFYNKILKKDKDELVSIIIKLSDYYPEIMYEILDEKDYYEY